MINIKYCNDICSKGQKASDEFIKKADSAFDAAIDFWAFVEECIKTCPYKDKYTEENEK